MRADTGARALVIPCPACSTSWSTEQTLAGHLMDEHGLDPPGAVRRALEASSEKRRGRAIKAGMQRDEGETRPMRNEDYTCGKCGVKGHNARSPECPRKGQPADAEEVSARCGSCHHPMTAHLPSCRRGGGKKHKPVTRRSPKAATSPNGFAGALSALRAERTELDAAIAALERLEARGR